VEGSSALSWQRACAFTELVPNQGISVKFDSERVALFLVNDAVYAVRDRCPHQGALLSKGGAYPQTEGPPIVVCPVHYWTFSLTDGACPYHPNMQAVVFQAEVRDGEVWVNLGEAGGEAQGK
jgi:NAD(P)H-dependent nitrite reductase small subunit